MRHSILLKMRRVFSTFWCCIVLLTLCWTRTTNSFLFSCPFSQRASRPTVSRNDHKHIHNIEKTAASTILQQPSVSDMISSEQKHVANVIVSSIIEEVRSNVKERPAPEELNVNIREANYADLLSVSALRINVFYPELITNGAFHSRILEKLRNRKNDGAICLVALEKKESVYNPSCNGYRYGHVLGTIEFSPNDFKNTSMQHIGDPRKLYAMDLAIRKSARRYGLATRLLHSIEIYAANHDYREVYLHVEAENKAARYLYKKCGYEEIDLSVNRWAREFTLKRLHKTPESYVFLYKQLSLASQRGILGRQSRVMSHMIPSSSSSSSSSAPSLIQT